MVAPKLKGWVVVSYPMPNDDAEGPLFSSVQESGDECTGWDLEVGLGVDGHVPANRDLKRSESTGSESSVASELLSEMQGMADTWVRHA